MTLEAASQFFSKIGKPILDGLIGSKKVKTSYQVLDAIFKGGYQSYFEKSFVHYARIYTFLDNDKPCDLLDVYTPLTLTQPSSAKLKIEINGFPKQLFNKALQHQIIDTAGVGKTTLARYIFLTAAQNKEFVPILVELRDIGVAKMTLMEHLLSELRDLGGKVLTDVDFVSCLKTGQILLILDGLEELDEKSKSKVASNIETIIKQAPNCPIILTSRPDPVLQKFPTLTSWRISRLSRPQAYKFIRKYEQNPERAIALENVIKRNRNSDIIETFIGVPLLLILLIASFDHKNNIPIRRHILFSQVYDALFDRHDNRKGGYTREKKSKLAKDEFEKILRCTAYLLFDKHCYEFNESDLLKEIEKAKLVFPNIHFDPSHFIQDLLRQVPLVEQCAGNLKFVHPTLQDYFAALFVDRDVKKKKELLLKLYNGGQLDGATDMLRLFADIDPDTFKQVICLDLAKRIETEFESFKSTFKNLRGESLIRTFNTTFFIRLLWVPQLFDETSRLKQASITTFRKFLKTQNLGYEELILATRMNVGGLILCNLRSNSFFKAVRSDHPIDFLRIESFLKTEGKEKNQASIFETNYGPDIRFLNPEEVLDFLERDTSRSLLVEMVSVDAQRAKEFIVAVEKQLEDKSSVLDFI
jgi:NACHT domain